jgi:hypothetical protein
VYKLGKNWQTRAWDPVFKTAGSAPDAAEWFLSILLFGVCQKNFPPCPVHPALLHNFGCCYIILMRHKKIKIKMNNSIIICYALFQSEITVMKTD